MTLSYGSSKDVTLDSGAVLPVVLDSGTTDIELPPAIAGIAAKFAGAIPIPENPGVLYVPCNLSTADANFTFGLGGSEGINITVPMSEIVLDWQGDYTFEDGVTRACPFGISSSETALILGDAFLRSTYAVFNLESKQIGLAQAKRSSGESPSPVSIVEIPPSGIPNAVRSVRVIPLPSQASSQAAQAPGKGKGKHHGATASATANPLTTITAGTVSVVPSKASFTATGSGPPEPSIYLYAASIAQQDSTMSSGTATTATTAVASGSLATGTTTAAASSISPFTSGADSTVVYSWWRSLMVFVAAATAATSLLTGVCQK